MTRPLWTLGARGLSERLATGTMTPLAVLDDLLDRHDRLAPALNAFTHLDRDGARRDAEEATKRSRAGRRRGPLDGIPVAVKDNIFVKGMPARYGSLLLRDHVADVDDICIERLRAAGAIIVGKTTTPEFALSGRTESRLSGSTRNPWDTALTAGGSSGGSVAAVAAGIVPLALGTDAGGSTRMPASYNGLLGLRPSNGRIPRRHGFPPMSLDFQVIGLLARTVDDLGLLYGALAGPDPRDPQSCRLPAERMTAPRLRIGWFAAVEDIRPDDAVLAALDDVRRGLADLGHDIIPREPPYRPSQLQPIWDTLTAAGAARMAARFPDRWQAEMNDNVADLARRGMALPAAAYVEALDALSALRASVAEAWGDVDAFLLPTAPAPAWPAGEPHPRTIGGRPGSVAGQGVFCGWVNALGLPALNIPAGRHPDGRPVGVQIVARFAAEADLFRLAAGLEPALQWAGSWPALAETV
ncbi:amidase [Labrys wisconsinensis]|uniref:Aspartyl-tRNA(Asn)/glutamyl-tRNA(Gln) amidotransferase subunit A n=1 Tax=Labrys wisconsinensis TaxID=425677 RepID=A0ABU0JM09_9HYPH|nr:amidase [Labrys wisconsinensis]MDQ0475331.1 aspartyl-tRNA(Asn)/glutamyl-tRNA(Gln) amidotransferase subunit A [Labrys wisconsinensis]